MSLTYGLHRLPGGDVLQQRLAVVAPHAVAQAANPLLLPHGQAGKAQRLKVDVSLSGIGHRNAPLIAKFHTVSPFNCSTSSRISSSVWVETNLP